MPKELSQRSKTLRYIEGVLIQGMTKSQAYKTYVNDSIKDASSAVARLERSKEFQDLQATLMTDENYKFKAAAQRVKGKYLGLIEKNIDKAGEMLDEAGSTADKAKAVRLTNETIQAMAIVATPVPQQDGAAPINKAGVIS